MIIKFFKSNNNPKATLDYLIGKDKNREHAKILQGNVDLSLKIADSLDFSNRYTVGCLSFEERDLPEEQKKDIIERFESSFLSGLEPDQYNITWIEHTDKNRVELNFFIPNVELTTQKRLQPYYDKADRPLAENFKQVINHEYGLSDPNAPEKQQILITRHDLPKDKKEALNAINDGLMALAQSGKISNRDDVISALQNNGFEIARTTSKNISIKTDGQNLRLKGAFYDENFRFSKELQTDITERDREHESRSKERYRTALAKLNQAVDNRKREHSRKYQTRTVKVNPKNDKDVQATNAHSVQLSSVFDSNMRNFRVNNQQSADRTGRYQGFSRQLQTTIKKSDSFELYSDKGKRTERKQALHSDRQELQRYNVGRQRQLQNNQNEIKNDTNTDNTAFRERINRIIETARKYAQSIIEKVNVIGTRERTDQTTIQSNDRTVNELKQHTSEIKEIVNQVQKQRQSRSGMSF